MILIKVLPQEPALKALLLPRQKRDIKVSMIRR
jgi:hypothetical protein